MTDLKESPALASLPGLRGRSAVSGRSGRAGRTASPGVALAIVLTGQAMAVLDTNIVNVAVPSMHATLGASGAALQLIVAGYTIAYAVLLVTGARIGDILGHRRVYLAGVALFTLASLGCGLAPTTGALVALRFLQGAGAAVMIPQVLSLIQRSYTSPGPRARAMSLYATVISGGAVLGQVLGGLLVSADLFGSSWRPVFLVNVPIGLAVLAAGRLLPKGRFDGVRTLDLPGLAVLTPAVLAFVLPLVLGQPLGWPAWGWVLLCAVCRRVRPARRRGAQGRRARRPADPAQVAARPSRHGRRSRRAFRVDGGVRRLAVRPGTRTAGRPRRLAAAGRADLRPLRRRVRARQHELEAAARAIPRKPSDGRVRDHRHRSAVVRAAAARRRHGRRLAVPRARGLPAAAWRGRSAR